ncbi:MAG: Response regulator containing a CheY-like receiver domain and an DNA-binding domain, partial [Frankiales bacterium]|nr:Response regulator containing a CheY-like receiver domain and an DNA-binding domain [Frankiales bacterium]
GSTTMADKLRVQLNAVREQHTDRLWALSVITSPERVAGYEADGFLVFEDPTRLPDGRPEVTADGPSVSALLTRLSQGLRGATASQSLASSPGRPVAGFARLSSRELDVVSRLLAGDRVPAIAQQLFLSQGTIRNHLSSVFHKLGVKSQQELIALLRPRHKN